MRDDADLARPALAGRGRRLPAAALAGLQEAFAAEVAERLPRLRAAVDAGDPAGLDDVVRDAHALGSSAAVMGEPEASRSARAAEALLVESPRRPDVVDALRAHVDDLARELAGWTS